MKLFALLATYLGLAAGLFGGLVGGVLWFVKADPSATQAPRVAPVSPRIAESIERKMAATPVTPMSAASTTETKVAAEPVKPVMKEADAALTHAPQRVHIREFNQRPVKRKPSREEHTVAARDAPPAAEAPAAHVPVSTVRTDFPY